MKTVIMVNGAYGPLEAYRDIAAAADALLAVDGGANAAHKLQLRPDLLLGDMDSIAPGVYQDYIAQGVEVLAYPAEKDFTDTVLALQQAESWGSSEIILLGSLGKRSDHAWANLCISIPLAQKGIKIVHWHPDYSVYVVDSELVLHGTVGDTVSVFALTPVVEKVTLTGFYYTLQQAQMRLDIPSGVSNRLVADTARIQLDTGVLAVFHYRKI